MNEIGGPFHCLLSAPNKKCSCCSKNCINRV